MRNVLLIECDETTIGHYHSQQAFDKGGFAGTVRPYERDRLSFITGSAYIVQRCKFRKSLCNVCGDNHIRRSYRLQVPGYKARVQGFSL
jgi:hypothetical protein